jgi:hypothetical protein
MVFSASSGLFQKSGWEDTASKSSISAFFLS